jgi:predicted thioesterase
VSHKLDPKKKSKALIKEVPIEPVKVETSFEEIKSDSELAALIKLISPKHKLFADKYLDSGNVAISYQDVYHCSYDAAKSCGSRLLIDANLQKYLMYRWKKRQFKHEMSEDKLIGNMLEVYKRSMQIEPVLDDEGEPTGEYRFMPGAAIQSNRLIAQIMNYGSTNNKKSEDMQVLVTTYVVPAFNNAVAIPESSQLDVKKRIEKKLKEQKKP